MMRRCLDCPSLIASGSRCATHALAYRGSGWQSTRWRNAVLAAYNYRCAMASPSCSGPLEADHIVPIAKGGAPLDVRNGRLVTITTKVGRGRGSAGYRDRCRFAAHGRVSHRARR